MKSRFPIFLLFSIIAACSDSTDPTATTTASIDELARDYLFLELSMGWHDSAHVDAYFGPEEIQVAANKAQLSLNEIHSRAATLADHLGSASAHEQDPARLARIDGLLSRLIALDTRVALNQGETRCFDEVS